MKYGVGQPVRRKEDIRLVTGRGTYTDDIVLPNQAYGVFVRSPHAHARITRIDLSEAQGAPGVIGFLTADDLKGLPTMPVASPTKNRDGSPLRVTPKTFLASGKVRFCGEAVVLVVASSAAEAKDAAERVLIDYQILPAVASAANAAHGVEIWDDVPGNLSFDWIDGDEQACAAAFGRAARIVRMEVAQNRVMPAPMEPRGAIGAYDAGTGRFTLYTGTQGGATVRDRIAGLLKVDKQEVRVVTPDVGGAFGQKISIVPEQSIVLLAARKFGRPVKWIGERSEAFLADAHGRDVVMQAELAFDADARISAIRVSSVANLGAYLSQAIANVTTTGGMRILGGVYRVPVAFVNVKGFVTNTAPLTAYRGAGRPEVAYVMERLLDRAGAAFGLDAIEIRRRNLLSPEELPHKNWKGMVIDSGEFVRNLEDAARAADWTGFAQRGAESERRGKRRGRGLAYYVEASGGPSGREPGMISFGDNGAVEITLGTQSTGQGHETSFAQLVSDRLGVPFDKVLLRQGDTDHGMAGLNSVGSRSLQAAGGALVHAIEDILRKGSAAAAHILQAGGAPVSFAVQDGDGRFAVSGTERSIGLLELAAALKRDRLPGFERGLDSAASFDARPSFPNGCHICEVEVDPETGTVEVVRYVIVDDLGRVINPLLVEGQIHGGVAQGLGQALMEHAVYDDATGQFLTATFVDYAIPRAEDVPALTIRMNEVPCTTNPLGSKGAGEAGTVGALPAIISAVSDALGIAHLDMPATPERVWRALQSGAAAQ